MKKLLLLLLLFITTLASLENVPRTIYKLETKDGHTIKLACPVIEAGRSIFTYTIDGHCVIYK